ncbi:hypothetical protein D2T31_11975 [Sinirhodobacter populi]|uniref:Uncharacterized protein n=1 Tax=Paenirhodobacter populi TaxID=2306993 RepID=A0A443K7T2_9RHOB|nr:hypothetical protein [Sinirhodobacter populi]RWR28824.1 hypothetical protein D2T31_11975 [Sinirhodobacter populi]
MTITHPQASRAVNASESNRQSRPAIKLAKTPPPFSIPPAKSEPTHAARLSVSALNRREARELERAALRTLPVFPTIADGVLAEDWS